MRNIKRLALVLMVVLSMSPAASADASTITWNLTGVTFDDGGALTGMFTTDSVTGNLLSYNITTTTGSVRSGYVYDGIGDYKVGDNYFGSNSFALANINPVGYPVLSLRFTNPLTSGGSNALVLGASQNATVSFEANNNYSGWRVVTAGSATAVPEPSTWLLLGTGLAAVAARRRFTKRT